MLQKPKRLVDQELFETMRYEPCVICELVDATGAHHVKSRGSYGPDVKENLMPVCFIHHNYIESKPLSDVAREDEKVLNWLLKNGWEHNGFKWINYEIEKIATGTTNDLTN